VIVADREAAGDPLGEAAEVPPHPLTGRLEGPKLAGAMTWAQRSSVVSSGTFFR
jgi:hypothetical protein